jgi:hypothetical protein
MSRAFRSTAIVLTLAAWSSSPAQGQERRWLFDADPLGFIARGFSSGPGTWHVIQGDTGNVFAQTAKNAKTVFNITLLDDSSARDLDISVQMKAIAGLFEQGGGLVWRAQDTRNYYLCRYNPLHENFRLYKVVDGVRSLLQNAEAGKTPGWHSIGVAMTSDHIECFLDGKRLLAHDDASLRAAGKIGLWTQADAQSEFDDLSFVAR